MAEDVHRRGEFASALRETLARLEKEGVGRVDRGRVEELGKRYGVEPDEARRVFVGARGTMWRGELVRTNEEPGWEAAMLERVPPAGPVSLQEMYEEDRELLENPAAKKVWEALADRYPDSYLSPGTSLQFDLGVDSMEWIELTVEVGRRAGVKLDEEATERVSIVRDLLEEAAGAGEAYYTGASPVEEPEEVLDEEQKHYLEPLSPAGSVMARGLHGLIRATARGAFGLEVEGLENLPERGPYVIAPNHISYLDSFAVAAALDYRVLRRTYWAAYAGAAFGNPINGTVSRLAKAVPVDGDRCPFSSLAFGSAILARGNNLVWFPGGQRSSTGELQNFKPGIGVLLNRYRVPTVPVIVRGTYEAMPPGRAIPRPKKATVVFDRPLAVDDLEERGEGETPQDRIVQALHDRIAELIEGNA